jgi:hypothetical protein
VSEGKRWIKTFVGPDAFELMRANGRAYLLAFAIASRAKWRDGFSAHGLELGEALVGDHESIGLTRQEYRTAIGFLVRHGFCTIRTTNKGTIAKLTDSRVFEVGLWPDNHQPNQRPTDSQPLTKNNRDIESIITDGPRASSPTPEPDQLSIPEALATPEFNCAWEEWKKYQRGFHGKGKRSLAMTFAAQLSELSKHPAPVAVDMIRQSILKNWKGLYPVKPESDQSGSQNRHQGTKSRNVGTLNDNNLNDYSSIGQVNYSHGGRRSVDRNAGNSNADVDPNSYQADNA